MRRRRIIRLLVVIVLILVFSTGGFLFIGEAEPAPQIRWGVTFGQSQAASLGLDWKETYLAILDDLGARRLRLPVYWDELEAERGIFDFTPWDWQLEKLAQRDGSAIIAVGRKLPRWPECRVPRWFSELSQPEQDQAILAMVRAVVERYRDNPTVVAWQVENEPFLHFGICPKPYPIALVDREIALVRELDPSRPIIITDTGEFSTWLEAGKRADILGSTVYRIIYDPLVGYVRYPFPPVFYHRKAVWIHWWYPKLRIIITEAQAEPWVIDPPISNYPLEEQYKTMSPTHFRDQIAYLQRTGFDEVYLWGAEWWYWLKTEKHTEIWNAARALFRS